MKNNSKVSAKLIRRLKIQGYCEIPDDMLMQLAFGNRFAYILCTILLGIGVATANVPLLCFMMLIAFLGIVLPNHPFDYIYNHVLRKPMRRPKLPPRSKQLKFACVVATLWLGATIGLFHFDYPISGYVVGGILFSLAFTVSATDICVPSLVYNYFNRIKV